MASIYVIVVILALLSLLVSADNSDESSNEVVVRNSPVFNSISKIYTQLHSPGSRQQYNQFYPSGRIPYPSFTRFSEVTKSGFANKQFLSSYEDKTVRRMGSGSPSEVRGPQLRILRPNYSNDGPAGQVAYNENPRYQHGWSRNGGNRKPMYGRREEEGDSYTQRGYGSRGTDEEGSEEEGEEEGEEEEEGGEEGGEENKEQEQDKEGGGGERKESEQNSGPRRSQSARRRDGNGNGRPHKGSSSSSDSRRRLQASYGDRAPVAASQSPRYPFNLVSEWQPANQPQQFTRNQFQQIPTSQFQQNPSNRFQQYPGNLFQQKQQGIQFQQNPANRNQENPVKPSQLHPRNQFQLNSGNLFQQNRGNQNQLNPGNQFQPHQRNQNQMQTNGQIQENLHHQNRGTGQPGNKINRFSVSRIADNPFQQATGLGNRG